MANRIKIPCLGATLAPYSSLNLTVPKLLGGAISEELSFNVDQLQACRDTTSDEQTAYPAALGFISIKHVHGPHFSSEWYYIAIGQDDVNTAAND